MSTQLRNVLAVAVIAGLMAGCETVNKKVLIYQVPPFGIEEEAPFGIFYQEPPFIYQGVPRVIYLMQGAPPTIIEQPATQIKQRGTHVDFTVLATNAGSSLTYQWQRNGIEILAATNKTYAIEGVQFTNVASYTCAVTGNGTVVSEPAHLSVYITYYTNSVAGTLQAPIGAFSSGAVVIDGVTFDRVSSNYFKFFGPNASGRLTGAYPNSTYMHKLTVDTLSLDNNSVDTAIALVRNWTPLYTLDDNDNDPSKVGTALALLSKCGPFTLSLNTGSYQNSYRVVVYYRNATIGTNDKITFNWLYHD